MKCPICESELEIRSKKTGETGNGETVYSEFAICHNCKKQWNLDKHRAKNTVEQSSAQKTSDEPPKPKKKKKRPTSAAGADAPAEKTTPGTASPRPKKKRPAPKPEENEAARPVKARIPESSETPESPRPKKKRPTPAEGAPTPKRPAQPRPKTVKPASKAMDEPIDEFSDAYDEKTYSNIPPKRVRETREREVQENYQNMLDEDDDDWEEDERRFPVWLIIIIVLIVLAAVGFSGYWFLIR